MTPQRWREVQRVLLGALELPPAERAALVDRECGEDEELRGEVLSLLAFDGPADGPLERPAVEYLAGDLDEQGPQPGTLFGPYRLLDRLGSGGMGDVFLAEDTRLGRRVAVKLLAPHLAAGERWRARFLREARLAAGLDHPHVCTIHEVGEVDGRPFLAMQYVEGVSLRELRGDGPLPLARLLPIALQVADALATAHDRGIVHRDVKAANVVVGADGRAKVLDFGIAKHLGEEDGDAGLTATGAVLGTPGAMSPEQACGEPTDARSDVFSFGVLLYEMATGRHPFSPAGSGVREALAAVVGRPHVPAAQLVTSLPRELSALIDRALAKDPADRWPSMRAMLPDLQAAAAATAAGAATGPTLTAPSRTSSRAPRLAWLAAAAVVVALAVAGALRLPAGRPAAPGAEVESLAVLPFAPLVPSQRDEPLELGMADTLIARLASIRGLEVRPISAVRAYAGIDQDALAAGREQRVDAVLAGHIQKGQDEVRVTVSLLRVADGATLWTEQIDAPLTGLFALQDAIAARVADALRVRLSGRERERLRRRETADPEAYRLYLLAHYHLGQRTRESIARAIGLFERAVARDPSYAQAHASLGGAYTIAGWWEYLRPHDAYPKARLAVERALALDPELAEAHAVLGSIRRNYDWDWEGADASYRRAIELDPNHAAAHHWYGMSLALQGERDRSVAELRRALELDPVSLIVNNAYGWTLLNAGRHEEAIAQYHEVLEIQPFFATYLELGMALLLTGREEEAFASFREGLRLYGATEAELERVAGARQREGWRAFWREVAAVETRLAAPDPPSSYLMADYHAAQGDREGALALLEQAYRERSTALISIKVDPFLVPLRDDPRYRDLLRRVGLAGPAPRIDAAAPPTASAG